jgi:hypothetical protein
MPTPLEGIETLTLPDEAEADEDNSTDVDEKKKKPAKDKSLKVPNFNKFRLWLFLGIVVIVIVIGLFFALSFLPKAKINITTSTSNVNTNLTLTLSTSAQSVNLSTLTIPARAEQQQKTTSQQVNTTGQQNNGIAATGTINMIAAECTPSTKPYVVASGTGASAGGLTYIIQPNTVGWQFTKTQADNNCPSTFADYYTASQVPITAQSPGSKYNVSSAPFTVAGRSDITATGSASGGTDSIVQVVAQADIDSATQKLASQNTSPIKSALEQQLTQDGLYPIPATFSANTPSITSSSNVGDQATTVTVTQSITYTMYGAMKSDLEALIDSNVDSQINTASQTIINDGLSSGTFGVVSSASGDEQVSLLTTAVVGPNINAANIKKEVAGKRSGDAQTFIGQLPGVTSVKVYLSPFWVGSVPTNPSKVTVDISKAH